MLHTTTSKLLICLATLFLSQLGNSQTLFQKVYSSGISGGNSQDALPSRSIAKINNNRFILSGKEESSSLAAPFLMCTDSLGEKKWAKMYKYTSIYDAGEYRSSIYTSDKNIVSVGQILDWVKFKYKGIIVKVDTTGEVIRWSKVIGDTNTNVDLLKVKEDNSGNLYCVGSVTPSSQTFGTTGFIVKLNENGDVLWEKMFKTGTDSSFSIKNLTFLTSGEIIIVGDFYDLNNNYSNVLTLMNSNGEIISSKSYPSTVISTIVEISPNEFLLDVQTTDLSGSIVLGIMKVDADFSLIWSKLYNNPRANLSYFNTLKALKLSPNRQFIYSSGVDGHNFNTEDSEGFLAKYTLDGELLWYNIYGYCDSEIFEDFEFGDKSSPYLTGVTRSYGGAYNAFLVRTDTSGYCSFFDDKYKPTLSSITISEDNATFTIKETDPNFIYSSPSLVISNVTVEDSLICSSTNAPGINFTASDTVVCAKSCISFVNTSIFHQALDAFMNYDGSTPTDTSKSYKWLFEGGSGEDLVENPSEVCYDTPGTFDVSLIVTQGCKIDTFTRENYITVIEKNSIISIVGDSSVCSGNPATLTASGAGSYTWSPATGLNVTSGATVIANPSNTTTYTVTGKAGTCVIEPKTVTVTINTTPDVSISPASPLLICAGESKTITATGASSYTWSPATGLSSTNSASVTASPTEDITYKVIGANGSCKDSAEISVSVKPAPVVEPIPDITMAWGNSTTLSVIGGEKYSWSPAEGLSCSDCANPIATPTKTTTYCVTVSDTSTCTTSECLTIYLKLDCGQVFVPTSFSPNGDNLNDLLEVKMNPACIETFEFILFDRWGEKVFESSKITNSWDGKFNGKELDNAVFVYQLKMKLVNETTETIKKGNVTIIR